MGLRDKTNYYVYDVSYWGATSINLLFHPPLSIEDFEGLGPKYWFSFLLKLIKKKKNLLCLPLLLSKSLIAKGIPAVS